MTGQGGLPADENGCCGDDSGADCHQVLHDVWLFLDNEMDPGARAAVAKHLDDCSPCLAEAGIDEKLKNLVHRKCAGERAPEQLRDKLASAIRSITVESTVATASADGRTVRVESVRVEQTRQVPRPDQDR